MAVAASYAYCGNATVGFLGPAQCRVATADTVAHGQVTRAAWVPAGTPVQVGFAGGAIHGLPPHCLILGEVNSHTGGDGIAYGDRFELRLPARWNGRFLFQGGGGLDGVLQPALGLVSASAGAGPSSALARGFAVISTDGGHEQALLKSPGDFGRDPGALADYEYDSTRRVTRVALGLVRAYYRHETRWTYFMGCSNGGREGLIAAQRYPQLFDGIVAGSPAFDLTGAMVAEAWNSDVLASIAPRNAQGRPELAQALSVTDLNLLAHAVLARCDALDGARDGLVSDPAACHFDPGVLACRRGQLHGCLTPQKLTAIRKVFAGPVSREGRRLYSSWPYDPGIAAPGWRFWMLGSPEVPALNVLIAPAAVNGVALGGQAPAIDLWKFNFESDPARIARVAKDLDAVSTDYRALRKRHGKLLMYAGMADPVFSANDLIAYYRRVLEANGGARATQRFARLFLVPGMNHCGGGPATDEFDALSAIQDWVEQGSPPKRLVASGPAFPGATRPLCPYPAVARYSGSGHMRSAGAFVCR
ncbi:MAG TPA: tannase/feruloyl esterase family alpha/beta hydrolase [Steroidobacteraceae bacterium]